MKSFLKKFFIGLGSLFGLLVVAAIVIPLVVDVDKYRPVIVEKANEYINGKLEIGKLSLSLWGRVNVRIDGLKLFDAKGQPVVDVKDAALNIPLMSVISGAPEIRLVLSTPQVSVIRFRDGSMNVMTLAKPSAGTQAGGAAQAKPGEPKAAPQTTGQAAIPAAALKARFTFLLSHAKLAFRDEFSGDIYNVNDLGFSLRDVSLDREMPFELKAQIDILARKKIKMTGPLVFDGSLHAIRSGGAAEKAFEKLDLKAALNLDGVEIRDPGMFDKKPGVPLGFEVKGTVGKDEAQIPVMRFRLAGVTIDSQVSTKTAGDATSIDFKLKSNRIEIAPLGELVSMIKAYGLNGAVELSASADGPVSRLDYAADLKFEKINLMHESMKQPLQVNGAISIVTNKLRSLDVRMTAKDFDLAAKGMLENFLQPRFQFTVASNAMDLDGLLVASEKAAQARKAQAAAASAGAPAAKGAAPAAPVVDYNAMFAPLRTNPIAAATSGTLDFKLKRVKSTGVVMEDIGGAVSMNNLLIALKDFSMRLFGGSAKGTMSFNARPAKPEVGTNLVVTGLQTQKMVESQMPVARNTVKGVIASTLNIGGAGLNPNDVISGWKGSGTFSIKDAVFSTMDFGPQIRDGVIEKLPAFAKSKVKVPANIGDWRGDYESVESKFSLAQGVFTINELKGKARPNKGLDLKGGGTVKLQDYALDLSMDFIDTYNWLGLDSTAKDRRYGHFALVSKIKCTMFSPCFDWGSTIASLAKNAAESKGKEALTKAVAGKLPGAAGAALGKALGGGEQGGQTGAPAAPQKEDVKKALKGLFGR
ncbi:MAG: AsmA family protein [Deltaproteobacteria bacterium]|nr:AsmA family protein [Deltaproteobacteria bacterium]